MPNAAELGWGAGWPNCRTDEIVTVVCGGNGLRLPVRKQLAPLIAGLVTELEAARGRPFRPDWSWGFACRPISGTRQPSNHSQGCAIDLDAPENPYATVAVHASPHPLRKNIAGRTLRTTMPADVVDIARRWGFTWGGLYATKPDPMHFDPAVTPAQAAQLTADLRALDGRPQQEDIMTPAQHDEIIGWLKALAEQGNQTQRAIGAAVTEETRDEPGLDAQVKMLRRGLRAVAEAVGLDPATIEQ